MMIIITSWWWPLTPVAEGSNTRRDSGGRFFFSLSHVRKFAAAEPSKAWLTRRVASAERQPAFEAGKNLLNGNNPKRNNPKCNNPNLHGHYTSGRLGCRNDTVRKR